MRAKVMTVPWSIGRTDRELGTTEVRDLLHRRTVAAPAGVA
jgi:hypothetical protein